MPKKFGEKSGAPFSDVDINIFFEHCQVKFCLNFFIAVFFLAAIFLARCERWWFPPSRNLINLTTHTNPY